MLPSLCRFFTGTIKTISRRLPLILNISLNSLLTITVIVHIYTRIIYIGVVYMQLYYISFIRTSIQQGDGSVICLLSNLNVMRKNIQPREYMKSKGKKNFPKQSAQYHLFFFVIPHQQRKFMEFFFVFFITLLFAECHVTCVVCPVSLV